MFCVIVCCFIRLAELSTGPPLLAEPCGGFVVQWIVQRSFLREKIVQSIVHLLFTYCTMALPQHKTTLSILRSILGPGAGGEVRFANKIGRSTSWLRKACCGQIPLMREAALSIFYETGISLKWLMDGDTAKPPVDHDGKPYTVEIYALHRSVQREGFNHEDADISQTEMVGNLHQLVGSYCMARSKNRGGFFTFKLGEFVDQISKEFGNVQTTKNKTAARIAEDLKRLVESPPGAASYTLKPRKPRPSRRLRKPSA